MAILLDSEAISPGARALLAFLRQRGHESGRVVVSVETLGRIVERSPRTARRYLRQLEACGALLRTYKPGPARRAVYMVTR